jgi:uncharacterized protein (DUF58 family)
MSVYAESGATIPLYPRRRLVGSSFGGHTSIRRGEGSDVAGSRPYEPGDHFHTIDWKASARLSSARGADEFIVRERFSEEMPRMVIICDRRPEMALFPADLPWLQKPEAVGHATELLVASAVNQRGLVGYLDFGSHADESPAGTPFWQPPRAQANAWAGDLVEHTRLYLSGRFDAPADNVERALDFLAALRGPVPTGSFVFVFSDFVVRPSQDAWAGVVDRGWDVVPFVVQDPRWEQSFPPIAGTVVPVVSADGSRRLFVHLTRREVEARKAANERRLRELLEELIRLELDPVVLSDSTREGVHETLLAWAEQRFAERGHRQ